MSDFGFRVDELFEEMECSEGLLEAPPLDLQGTPLGSLGEAIAPLEDALPDILTYTDQSEAWFDRQPSPPLGLPQDQALAMHLFLTPWTIRDKSLSAKLNAALRAGGEQLQPYKRFLRLLLAPFTRAPAPAPSTLWIGTETVRSKLRPQSHGLLRGLSLWKTGEIDLPGYGEKEALECKLNTKTPFLDVSPFFECASGPLILLLPGFRFKVEEHCVRDQVNVYRVSDVLGTSHIKGVQFPLSVEDGPISFVVPASPASTLLKPKISAVAQNDSYIFTPHPLPQEDYRVEVALKPNQLAFRMQSSGSTLVQTFNLPFEFSSKDVSLVGGDVKLKFPF